MAEDQVNRYQLVAIGGSAGSLDALLKIIGNPQLPTSLFYVIVIHRKTDHSSILSELLGSRTHLFVREVEDKEMIRSGTIYVAPPDYHLLIENEKEFSLDSSEKVHHSRPSIDVCFESIAQVFGKSVIGILLSGANADGAEGLKVIRNCGGFTMVQNPQHADVSYMPLQAIQAGAAVIVTEPEDMVNEILRVISKSP